MTPNEEAELLAGCPTLFHMAERAAWPSIRRHGLLSTSALLDLYGVTGPRRTTLEACRRPEGSRLSAPQLEGVTLRDRISLSAINSGSTRPFGVPRGRATFLPIADYPYAHWRARRPCAERVVELAVCGGVPDIARLVRRVVVMQGPAERETLFERPDQ